MKKLLFILVFILTSIQITFSQCTLQQLGPNDFNGNEQAMYTDIATDGNGVPYVVYKDLSAGGKATVMKYIGSSWVTVGSQGFSPGSVAFTSIAIDGNNAPYVAFTDEANNNAATVIKYNGSNWVIVGTSGFSAGQTSNTSIALDGNGSPYVAYLDATTNNFTTVMKYNGSNWVTVGTAGFSAGTVSNSFSLDLSIDASGTPYVVYSDGGNGNAATVMKFNGSNWTTVGSAGFSAGQVNFTSIAINPVNNMPYVVYSDWTNGFLATAMNFDGTSWTTVGIPAFSGGPTNNYTGGGISYTDISIDNNGTPFVVYTDSVGNWKSTVMAFNGTAWIKKATFLSGPRSFNSFNASYNAIAIDKSNIAYVIFADTGTYAFRLCPDNINNNPITTAITNSTITNNSSLIQLYPNPNNGSFNIELNADAQISITNTLGQVVLTQYLTVGNHQLDLQSQTTGMYLIQATNQGNIQSVKMIKGN